MTSGPKRFIVHENFNKLTHDEREHCNSEHQNNGTKETLNRTYWSKITKSDCRERRNSKVPHLNELVSSLVIIRIAQHRVLKGVFVPF